MGFYLFKASKTWILCFFSVRTVIYCCEFVSNFWITQERLEAAKQKFGREICVFETTTSSPTQNVGAEELDDDFFEFTQEDYHRIQASKKEDKYLKTKKIRDAEEAARRSRLTKAVIRVRFPDNHTLEATFHPSETIQDLVDLLVKVLARPDLPFYMYTTPPKKPIREMSQDFYSAGFTPGAIVHFSYDLLKGDDAIALGPFLGEDVMSLKDLELLPEPAKPIQQPDPEPVATNHSPPVQELKPLDKKAIRPKWLKM